MRDQVELLSLYCSYLAGAWARTAGGDDADTDDDDEGQGGEGGGGGGGPDTPGADAAYLPTGAGVLRALLGLGAPAASARQQPAVVYP